MTAEELLRHRQALRGRPAARVLTPLPLDAVDVIEDAEGRIWMAARPDYLIDAPISGGDDIKVRKREGVPTVLAECVLPLPTRYFRLVDAPHQERRVLAPPDARLEIDDDDLVLVHSEDSDLLWEIADEQQG